MKIYRYSPALGRARHCVFFHDGHKTHEDGSPFFDLHICRNKRNLARFVRSLEADGYTTT